MASPHCLLCTALWDVFGRRKKAKRAKRGRREEAGAGGGGGTWVVKGASLWTPFVAFLWFPSYLPLALHARYDTLSEARGEGGEEGRGGRGEVGNVASGTRGGKGRAAEACFGLHKDNGLR